MLYGQKFLIVTRNTSSEKETVYNKLQHRQESQKKYYDRHARDLTPLNVGQQVHIQDPCTRHWVPASLRNVCQEPRSYVAEAPAGSILGRNRHHISDTPVIRQVNDFGS